MPTKEYYWKNLQKCRDINVKCHLKQKYNLTLEEYNKMLEEQNGCCAICGKHQSEFKQPLHVDHNHTTGQVRALLCKQCNCLLGYIEKNIINTEIIEKLSEYLKRYPLN